MMPQPTQHSLIHVLLLWITLLSIIQAVFIIFFFTGHRGLSQNSSTVTPGGTVQPQTNITTSPTPEHKLLMGQMLSYKAFLEDKGGYKWEPINPIDGPVSGNGKDLQINKDGYYFLILQVTLNTCTCNGTKDSKGTKDTTNCKVSVKWKESVLLQGWINTNTCSTGLLGTAAELSAGGMLEFKLPETQINDEKYLTHLDIIYMHRS